MFPSLRFIMDRHTAGFTKGSKPQISLEATILVATRDSGNGCANTEGWTSDTGALG